MPVNHVDFVDTRLAVAIKPTDTTIRISVVRDLRDRINRLPIGDHAYFIIQVNKYIEVVKYTHTKALPSENVLTLAVERGQHGTRATSFPAGSCVYTEITKAFLDEWFTVGDCCADIFPLVANTTITQHIPGSVVPVYDDNNTVVIGIQSLPGTTIEIPITFTIDAGGVVINKNSSGE